MRIATVKLRRKKDGSIIKVNQIDYARDLGKHEYRGYELVSDQHNEDPVAKVEVSTPHPEQPAQAVPVGNSQKPTTDAEVDASPEPEAAIEDPPKPRPRGRGRSRQYT